jgi:hypothetical protein
MFVGFILVEHSRHVRIFQAWAISYLGRLLAKHVAVRRGSTSTSTSDSSLSH